MERLRGRAPGVETLSDTDKTRTRFYWSMRLILAGLVVELLSLFGLHHPLGFMAFAALGCTLMGAGIVIFVVSLLSLVRAPGAESSD
ncbi:MAG: hypothetical protein BMS9Abin37_0370 [Acidobacteriota bacterium]|nr:MAG: hypothetical protein BMS9Abin37_0370 [Acidobacteriota bacterium]